MADEICDCNFWAFCINLFMFSCYSISIAHTVLIMEMMQKTINVNILAHFKPGYYNHKLICFRK